MNNTIGQILRIIGYITIALGVIASLIIWFIVADELNGMAGFGAGLGTFVGTFVSGMMFLGFSEIIFLLESLNANSKTEIKDDELPEI